MEPLGFLSSVHGLLSPTAFVSASGALAY